MLCSDTRNINHTTAKQNSSWRLTTENLNTKSDKYESSNLHLSASVTKYSVIITFPNVPQHSETRSIPGLNVHCCRQMIVVTYYQPSYEIPIKFHQPTLV